MAKNPYEVFVEVTSLGEFNVPVGYDHLVSLRDFKRDYLSGFRTYGDMISDSYFSATSTVQMSPGQRFEIKVFRYQDEGSQSSLNEKWIIFMSMKEGARFLGANGLTFLFRHKRRKMAREFVYSSPDLPYALPKASEGDDKIVPYISLDSVGRSVFLYDKFNDPHVHNKRFVAFFEIK